MQRDGKRRGVDAAVGRRVRLRRQALGLSLATVARAAGMTELHLGRCERGDCPIPAERLAGLAGALGVVVDEFYRDLAWPPAEPDGAMVAPDVVARTFLGIPDLAARQSLLALMRRLAGK